MEEKEYLQNKLEFFEGGLALIKEDIWKLRKEFLKGRINKENIEKYKKCKADYDFVKYTIKMVKKSLKA
jgi:hypothetical protein